VSTFALIVNPVAGSGRAQERAAIAAKGLRGDGHTVEELMGSTAVETARLIDTARDQVDGVIVCGGDGMVHLAVQHLAGRGTPLGVIPAGTGNDAARSWGIPLDDPLAALDVIRTGVPKPMDVGLVRGEAGQERWFVQILSSGFDAIVNERANAMRWPRGPMRYNLAMLAELPRFRPVEFRLVVDGVVEEVTAMLIAIANGPSYGGGMLVCPDASYTDGLFDIMVLEPIGKIRFITLFPRVYSGRHVEHPKVRVLRGRQVRMEGVAPTYADGERVGVPPLDLLVVPQALHVWRGAASHGTA
jgi:diacylglycerol kinase (ATP)